MADNERPETNRGYSPDRENADPVRHPEAAAFVGNVWFWVLIVIAAVIVIWGVFSIF